MASLFNRVYQLTVGPADSPTALSVSGLRVQFTITLTRGPTPNRSKIIVTNFGEESRRLLQSGTPLYCVLSAGYSDPNSIVKHDVEVVFSGKLARCWNELKTTDWETHIESEDGLDARARRVSKVLGETSKAAAALAAGDEVKKAGTKLGNLKAALASAKKSLDIVKCAVLHGSANDCMTKSLDAVGLEHTIVNGAMVVVEKGQGVSNRIALISPGTGLVGSPQVGKKGFVKARTLITQSLAPPSIIQLESASISGLFRIEKATYKGDTHGNEWFVDLELAPPAAPSADSGGGDSG